MSDMICGQVCCGLWILYDCIFVCMVGHDLFNEYRTNNNGIQIEHIYPNYISRSQINVSELFDNIQD